MVNIGQRMADKLLAIPLPDLTGKTVLDVGCDHGFWSFLAANLGASSVLGLDRGRPVNGQFVDLVESNNAAAAKYPVFKNTRFERIDLGKQWLNFGRHDVIFMFSLYHHVYESAGGEHAPIWMWLHAHMANGGVLIWENPVDCSDSVVQANVSEAHKKNYTLGKIMGAAHEYFDSEYVGPARHESTRSVYLFRPKQLDPVIFNGHAKSGAGGASKAFSFSGGRRAEEFKKALGVDPFHGSLNIHLDREFSWETGYYPIRILDVVDRAKGLESEWFERSGRVYPVDVGGIKGFAFRFDGESYDRAFVEVISEIKIRDAVNCDRPLLVRAGA